MADQRQIQRLLKSVKAWNTWREQYPIIEPDFIEANLSSADLRNINLSEADLHNANLSLANLNGANLHNANLSGANLHLANLRGTCLTEANLSGANLSETNLHGADLAHAHLHGANLHDAALNDANLSETDLSLADLSLADLGDTRLINANLSFADLNEVYLQSANLSDAILISTNLSLADLSDANLSGADLSNTNLSGAQLHRTNFNGAILINADLSNARIGWTPFGDCDFRTFKGLETIIHGGPSPLSINSLYLSEGNIPEQFLRGTGAHDTFIDYAKSLTKHPIEYYTCFISYSSTDQVFAERLYADLQQKGIRCWFAPHSLKIGDHFPNRIEEAIRFSDKLLLILSQASVLSEWVEDEVRAALEKEEQFRKDQHQERIVLFPIQIDTAIEHTPTQWAAKLRRTRHIGNFSTWKDYDTYLISFQQLLRDLKAPTR